MNILFDTNIFIDISLKRDPFFDDSFEALNKVDDININGFILASTFTDIYYICKKNIGHVKTIDILLTLISTINILGINKDTIIFAIHSNFPDFEDAVQNAAAELNQIDLIITRNTKDFTDSKIPTQTPTDFLKKYKNN
ncbi:PIN domain-containing protein [Pedobacter sp. ISL-68]|uniref:type II toxin-antitoxin system VapC family toxin n=1 Tax=unclassified Pedobacter TaxID=2628915 RepID=UPI001BECE1FB|nr:MULTISPECIES: PIN domain-containing protein [unclassified Pedobacter]MBT2563613.1 PIN domain-containing protein [Pedobacter sp. ISL-64]MBT2589505.1 PIN domain-containing protein [Pedobacter sp. ISL-68]